MDVIDYQTGLELACTGKLPRFKSEFLEVPSSIFVGSIDVKMPPLPPIAFYVKRDGKAEILRKADEPFSTLALSTIPMVLVHINDANFLSSHCEKQLLATNGALGKEKRMESLRRVAVSIVNDLFENPTRENIDRSVKIVGSFVYCLLKEPDAYMHLAQLSSHDPYTLQHSIGTAINTIILAKKTGVNTENDLREIGSAGLLHDIGKIRVKKEIINKPGPLNDEEWAEMRQHPEWGYDILKDHPVATERIKAAVLDHHEEGSGKGYPRGLKEDETDVCAKMVGLSDIFNALTTNRSYSKARSHFQAFELIKEKLFHKVNPKLFANLVLIYGGKF